ncbi:MAG: cyclodeaminase/cyclohydrolase family protein [Deltaproteobacteria bacterium]
MVSYRKESLERYANDLAARLPAPGGGSASALAASLGASLIGMVVNFTLGKPKYAKFEKELRTILVKSEALREKFLNLVDADVQAYQSKNVKASLEVPLEVTRLCLEGMKLCPALIKKGNINLISDVSCAAVFLESAFAGARINVEINLRCLGDRNLTRMLRKELTAKEKMIKRIRTETEGKVNDIIRG